MATLASQLDLPVVDGGHHFAVAKVQLAQLEAWHVVHAEHRIDGPALEQPVLDHGRAAAHDLLRGLEDQPNGAR